MTSQNFARESDPATPTSGFVATLPPILQNAFRKEGSGASAKTIDLCGQNSPSQCYSAKRPQRWIRIT